MSVPWGAILFLLCFCGLMGMLAVRKARRKKEQAYYIITGVAFLMFLVIGLALLNQALLAFIVLIVVGTFSAVMLPKVLGLYMHEIVEAVQETDVSAPLRIRDFLSWAWVIKLERMYGIHKTMLIYSLLTTGGLAAIMLVFNILGIVTPVMAVGYTILGGIGSIIHFHYQIRKVVKQNTLPED